VACYLKARISEAEQTSIASQRFDNKHPRQPTEARLSIAMQQSCKHDTAATNRETIQDGVRYSVALEITKGNRVKFATNQFTPAHEKESSVQKAEVKIRLPGRAAQNTEREDRVSSSCDVKL
jgi:uncharacterized lipoprotein YbaY